MRKVDIVIPVYNAFEFTKKCIETVVSHTDLNINTLLIINDKSSDKQIQPWLDQWASLNSHLNIVVKHNQSNLGFVRTVNIGLKHSQNDVLLLNSDTEVTPRWLEKLQKCAYSKGCIATVTPLSNNATLVSVPDFLVENDIPTDMSVEEYANKVEECSMHLYPELPTANGFCMYIKRDAIENVGYFDEVTFGKGYGEENDFCYRCMELGYRHLLCDDTYIYHKGTQSFNEEKLLLQEKHLKILQKIHPTCFFNTNLFLQKNPLYPIQMNIKYVIESNRKKNILMAVHIYQDPPIGNIGGTTMHVYDLVKNLQTKYNFHILYHSNKSFYLTSYFQNSSITKHLGDFPRYTKLNLYNDSFYNCLDQLIDVLQIDLIHVHHVLNLYLDIFKIAQKKNIPLIYTLHDYYSICPSINLVGKNGKPCHLDSRYDCAKCCLSKFESKKELITIWRNEFYNCMKTAVKLIAPSQTTKDIYLQYYPELNINVIGHGITLRKNKEILNTKRTEDLRYNIAFIGGISDLKGLEYMKGLIQKVKDTNIYIHLYGISSDNLYNIGSNHFIYHGAYNREELVTLLHKDKIQLICLLAIWAETFSYTLSESIYAGIPVVTLDIGAIAERVRKDDLGWVLPYGSSIDKVFETIKSILTDPILGYTEKVNNIRKYTKHAKTTKDMCAEYHSIYHSIIENNNSNKNNECSIEEKLAFFQKTNGSLLFNAEVFNLEQEYQRIKNLVIKGDSPFFIALSEVKKFRDIANHTKFSKKIVYKLIWYRIFYKFIINITFLIKKIKRSKT